MQVLGGYMELNVWDAGWGIGTGDVCAVFVLMCIQRCMKYGVERGCGDLTSLSSMYVDSISRAWC